MRAGILVLGIIFLVGAFIFSHVIFNAQQQSQSQIGGSLCNSGLGTIGSALSHTVATDCQNINLLNTLSALVPFAYLFGGILFILGLVIPGSKKAETRKRNRNEENDDERPTKKGAEGHEEAMKILKKRYVSGEISAKKYREMKVELEE